MGQRESADGHFDFVIRFNRGDPMKSVRIGAIAIIAALLALVTVVSCTRSKNQAAGQSESVQIIGAGSTFVYPLMSQWISNFHQSHPNVQINYQSIGSGGGIQQLKKGLVDFGASDAALDDTQLKDMPPLVQIPESAGPVCITYNLPELKEPLKLTAATLSGIYLGTIKNWHNAVIEKDNPGVKLPNVPIVVAHRSDGSGTTNIFTTYLATVSPEWSKKVGKGISVSWPVGLGAKGSEGVTGIVKQTPGGIGYVELNYAETNNLPVALVRNKAGQWIKPSSDSATAAIEAFSKELQQDVRTPIVEPPASAKDAYPISGLTFLLVPKNSTDATKRSDLKAFITYAITDGQQYADQLHYSKLPAFLQQHNQALVNEL
jgi:phosphate transport system substrate-binding protein